MATAPSQPRAYNSPYMQNGGSASGPTPGATPLLPNQGRILQNANSRILCIADVRGNLRSLNDLAKQARADAIIHTGDFGFYDDRSLDRIAEKTLRHVAQYSPLLSPAVKNSIAQSPPQPPLRERYVREHLKLSELPDFLNGTYTLDVPVYTVWGACEDVQVLEKLRSGEYKINNLHIIDEAHSRLVEAGGIKLRLLGLGGAVVMHKLFDNGEGRTTIAGGQGTMWTTLLQMGELVDTANRVYDPTETRIFVTHASPAREGLLNQLSVTLKADFSISAGLHFRYGSSYNEFSVNPTLDHYRGKLAASRASFNDVWETVKSEVEPAVSENTSQQQLLKLALDIVDKMPTIANGGNPFGGHVGPATGQIDESAFKNMWNFNLADAAYGWLVLDIDQGRIGTEMRAQGFNFAHRGGKAPPPQQPQAAPGAPNQAGPIQPQAQQARPAPQAAAPGQPQQKPTTQPPRTNQSPAPVTPQVPIKPATPKPVSTPGNVVATPSTTNVEKAAANEAKPNGTATQEKPADSVPKPDTINTRPPVHGLFATNAQSEEDFKALFPEEERAKIQRIEKGKGAPSAGMTAHFDPSEDLQAILHKLDPEVTSGKPGKPYIRLFKPRNQINWGTGRGGAQGSGYRSGGASDSEGGRGGRGGFRGGRGGRGGDRGRGRGRGGFKDGASPAPAGGDS